MGYYTQKQIILDHLKQFGSITSWDAIEKYKITRVSEYIRSLRHEDGLNIVSEKERNNQTHWVRYKLFEKDAAGQGRMF